MTVRVRIAPSPTGNLHIGTARTALFNWLFARRHGGTFILRIEDTDQERSKPEFTQNILDGLKWLGIDFDEGPYFQTQRQERYVEAVQTLLERGLAYYCYTSTEELEALREVQKAQKLAPRYDNRHRNLTVAERQAYQTEGRIPVVRFRIEEPREIIWHDLVRGEMRWNSRDLGGDLVIARTAGEGKIGLPLYNFAVVVDDIDMNISHVIRGEDHIANTAKQILLYEAFGQPAPQFAHTPLILNAQGAKISKRDGATSVWEFKEMGYLPEAFNNYMILLGWSPPEGREIFSLSEAAQLFDLSRVNPAGARFDWDKLNWLNSQYIHNLLIPDLCDRLIPFWQSAGYTCTQPRPWLEALTALVAPSLTVLTDAVKVTHFFFQEPSYTVDAEKVLQDEQVQQIIGTIAQLLSAYPSTEFTLETAQGLIQVVIDKCQTKKGAIMKPLRCALTGDTKGPEIMPTFVLLHQAGLALPRLQKWGKV
ncbi:MAG: glutamate--tRNA ligase [Pseudanabaenaceae cyanobacterium]